MIRKESLLLGVGILGCGPISQYAHFDACRKARNVELVAICDQAEDLVTQMAALHEPRACYTDYRRMLDDPRVQAVIVATADAFHVELCTQALAAGKHVLVEKPLGIGIEECERLCATAAASGRRVQVGNNRRFDPGIDFARRFIDEEMGQRMALSAWYCDSTYRYTMTDNLQPIARQSAQARKPAANPKADKERYFVLTHGSHLLDTARCLGGELTALRARLCHRFDAYCWFMEVDFADGSLGHLDLTIPIRGDFQEGFRIYGEHGSVAGRVHLPWFHKSSEVECFSTRDGLFRRPLGEDAFTYKLQLESFADVILHGKPQRGATVEEGTAAVRALVAIARSVASGEKVRLAEVTGNV